jgi:hypothetical protein
MENKMENQLKDNQKEEILQKVKEDNKDRTYKGTIEVQIRKVNKPFMPGAGPEELLQRIAASLDSRSGKSLKGINGDLEYKFMPHIINESVNSPNFQKRVEDYWSSISVVIPHDEEGKKETEQGYKIYIEYKVKGDFNYKQLTSASKVEDKINLLEKLLLDDNAKIEYDYMSQYALLSYCLKYKLVANNIADIHKSDKIIFYIFDKPTAIKNSMAKLEIKEKSFELFKTVKQDEDYLDYIILMFGINIRDYKTIEDKILKVDEIRNVSENDMLKFNNFASESNWSDKAFIKKCVHYRLLVNALNTTSYYYNDILIGKTLDEAVANLNTEIHSDIKNTLKAELASKSLN